VLNVLVPAGIRFEHLIIDGGSTDGSAAIAMAYRSENQNVRIVSEADEGIYDAMNKGLKLAKGEWVYFLNSGDEVCDPDGWRGLRPILGHERRSISFQSHQQYKKDIYVRGTSNHQLTYGPVIAHQGILVPRHAYAGSHFDKRLRISADAKWIQERVAYTGVVAIDKVLATFELGGLSNFPTLRSIKLLREEKSRLPWKEIVKWVVFRVFGATLGYRLIYFRKYPRLRG